MTVESTSISYTEEGFNLGGELTFSTVSSVQDKANSHIDSLQTDAVIIDLSKLNKIDSAGIALLIAWKRLCILNSKELQIIKAQKQAISLIKTNKLHEVLSISS